MLSKLYENKNSVSDISKDVSSITLGKMYLWTECVKLNFYLQNLLHNKAK